MQKARERTGSADVKRPKTKRNTKSRGTRKPSPEEAERLIEEDRKLVRFLSRGIAPFDAVEEQRAERSKDRQK